MKPSIVKSEKTDEIQLLLKFHPLQYSLEECWNTKTESPVAVKILRVRKTVQIPLLMINRISQLNTFLRRQKPIPINDKTRREDYSTFKALELSDVELRKVVQTAQDRYGKLVSWLNCCSSHGYYHGLTSFLGKKPTLLIQNHRESNDTNIGMFTLNKKILNDYYESIDSPIRFIKSYTVRKPIT